MLEFAQIVTGLDDLEVRASQIIAGHQLVATTAPFGAELLSDMDDNTAAHLGEAACIQSLSTQVDDSTVYGEEMHMGLHDPGEALPTEVTSIF